MTAEAVAKKELDPEKFFRTHDMAMSTYLRLQSHSVQQVSWLGPTCYWHFLITDGLLDSIEDFEAGEARVEPKEYSKKFSETKKEFYDSRDHRR